MSRSPAAATTLLAIALTAALGACKPQAEAPPAPAPEAAPAETAPAPDSAPAAQSEDAKPFAIGTLSAVALRDGALEFPNDNQVFGVGHTPEEVAAVLAAAGAPTDKLQLSLQPLLVKTADRVLLFDTGAGGNFGPGSGHLAASLAAAKVDPASVTDIFISHAHGDHVGGLVDAQGVLAFPNAAIHLSEPEWAFLKGLDDAKAKEVGIGQRAAFVAAVTPKVQAFAPGADLVPGVVQAVEIKGHTPGHSGYRIGAGQDTLLYVGDAMHHWVVSVQKPEWRNSFDGDQETGAASRSELVAQSAASAQRIYAVHFPFPGLGKVVKQDDGYAWSVE